MIIVLQQLSWNKKDMNTLNAFNDIKSVKCW